jgi:hypothetical protein
MAILFATVRRGAKTSEGVCSFVLCPSLIFHLVAAAADATSTLVWYLRQHAAALLAPSASYTHIRIIKQNLNIYGHFEMTKQFNMGINFMGHL